LDRLVIPEFEEIKRILLVDWDPIGVSDIPEAADEYDAYAAHIFTKLKSGWSQEDVAHYLDWAARENMGLGGEAHDEAIAADAQAIARRIVESRESMQ